MSSLPVHSKSKDDYSGEYHAHAFEQYKIYLEMTDRISSRRQSANSFFVTINTVLVTLAGYAKSATNADIFFYAVTSIAGILICYIWYRLVLSYKNLNSAKFKVIRAIEADLPYKPYDAEWVAVGEGKNKKLYHPFTSLEMRVPWIFCALHILVLAYMVPWSTLLPSCIQP
jgi:hypothetical protein